MDSEKREVLKMKISVWATLIFRFLFTLIVVVGIFKEAGFWTALFAFLTALRFEFSDYKSK